MKNLWIIPSAILGANVLFILFGLITNSGFVGSFMGGTAAIFTDPLILVAGILIGIFLPKKDIKMFLLILLIGTGVVTVVFHFIINTSFFMTDIIRFNNILILSSIVFLLKGIKLTR